jgi:hypothetical protein
MGGAAMVMAIFRRRIANLIVGEPNPMRDGMKHWARDTLTCDIRIFPVCRGKDDAMSHADSDAVPWCVTDLSAGRIRWEWHDDH